MAERPEDLNLPNAVITRIIKEAVSVEKPCLSPRHMILCDTSSLLVLHQHFNVVAARGKGSLQLANVGFNPGLGSPV